MVNPSACRRIKLTMGRLNDVLREKTTKEYRNFSDCYKALESCKTSESYILRITKGKTFEKYGYKPLSTSILCYYDLIKKSSYRKWKKRG